jgi:hypothetical protein
MMSGKQIEESIGRLKELCTMPFVSSAEGSIREALLALQLGVSKLDSAKQVALEGKDLTTEGVIAALRDGDSPKCRHLMTFDFLPGLIDEKEQPGKPINRNSSKK